MGHYVGVDVGLLWQLTHYRSSRGLACSMAQWCRYLHTVPTTTFGPVERVIGPLDQGIQILACGALGYADADSNGM